MNWSWASVDRWLMGEAWIGSHVAEHIRRLCDEIGVRCAGSDGERKAAEYITDQFKDLSLASPEIEAFELKTVKSQVALLQTIEKDSWSADVRPCLFCPAIDVEAPLVDVGYGMRHELDLLEDRLNGSVVLLQSEYEPFSEPRHLAIRLRDLTQNGVVAAITASPHKGRRLQHVSAGDWRDGDPRAIPLPLIQTTFEDAQRLRRRAVDGVRIAVRVESEFLTATSYNVVADLPGSEIENESLVLGAHHDTTPDAIGANDNAAGVAVLLDTARLLTELAATMDVRPGRTIRFVTFGAEEQGLQGSTAFVDQHYGPEALPKLMVNLDELATGKMKGVVLQFPELRDLVQQQLDSMNDDLRCHVLSQLDTSGDMFPFARRGIPSSFLWRWRFVGRHPDTAFGHSNSDTPDKIRLRELKEYSGLLARLLLRLSHIPASAWSKNELDTAEIAQRIELERGAVFRTM